MRTNKLFQWAGLACFSALTMMGCDKDSPNPEKPSTGKNDLAVMSMVTNADGLSGTSWLQVVDGISPKSVDNSKAYQAGFGMPPLPVLGNDIFTLPDYGQSNTFQKWTRQKDGTLVKGKSLELPLNSFATHGTFYSKEKGYLTTSTGKILIFNPSTMELNGEIDLIPYATQAGYPPYTGAPYIDGDTMYLPLWHVNQQRIPIVDPIIDILLIDAKTDTVIKRIQNSDSGLTHPGFPYGVQQNSFKDEKGDIYFIASGSFSVDGKYKSGILRINKDTQEIDPTYNWEIDQQPIEGETGFARWIAVSYYAGNGKMYAMMDMPKYWANPTVPNWLSDRSIISVEIDIYNKTIKKLPIPNSCSFAVHIADYDDILLFSVWGEESVGFYTYDLKTGKASDEAVIKMKGFPFWCSQLK